AESVWIFQTLGVEPWGRYASGVMELIAAVLLLIPFTRHFGALIAAGVMFGAVGSHIAILGIEVQNDGGLLFALALVSLIAALFVIFIKRKKILALIPCGCKSLIAFIILSVSGQMAHSKISYN